MIMDRLPLVQALTAAGLERHGAEQVATALGDAIESSVATKGDFGLMKADFGLLKADFGLLKSDFARLEATVKAEIATLENRMTLRLGGILVAPMGVLFALLRFTGHTP